MRGLITKDKTQCIARTLNLENKMEMVAKMES